MKLVLNSICKSYMKEYHLKQSIFESFSYTFKSNHIYLVCGESGKGKTTLLNIISSLTKIDSGNIFLDHYSLQELDEDQLSYYRKEYISYATQFFYFIENKTVLENIKMVLPDISIEDIINKAKQLKIESLLERNVKYLSGGEKQRVNLLCTILKPCQIMLFDEPTASLDDETAQLFLNQLNELKKDKIIIMTSHNIDLLKKFVDQVIEISDYQQIKENMNISVHNFPKNNKKMNFPFINTKHIIRNFIIINIIFLVCMISLIQLKVFMFSQIKTDIYNFPTLHQFIIGENDEINNYDTKQYFPLGNQLYNAIFNDYEYNISNVSIYLMKDNFEYKIKNNHIYVSDQLASIIANQEMCQSIDDIIGKKVNISLYQNVNENLTKEFIIDGIIETSHSMIAKDIYCSYNDVMNFYKENNLDDIIKQYKYRIVYIDDDNYLDTYQLLRNKGAYNETLENIIMTTQLLNIFNICFYSIIILVDIIYIVYLYSEIKKNLKKNNLYYIKTLLNGTRYKDIFYNEYKNILYNFSFIILFNIILIFIMHTLFPEIFILKDNIVILLLFIVEIYIISYIILYNLMRNMENKGIDILLKED